MPTPKPQPLNLSEAEREGLDRGFKRGNFTSLEQLKDKVLAFVEYYNQTEAKPFK